MSDKSIQFEVLHAFNEVPDHKHSYVLCSFYKKGVNRKLYVRQDLRVYKHKIMKLDHDSLSGCVCVNEIQRHPVNDRIIHMDFFIIDDESGDVRIKIPLKFENLEKSSGIKLGGFLNITSRQIEVKVKKGSLVPYIPIDVSPFAQEQSIRTKHIHFPEGIKPLRENLTVATVMPSKGSES